MNNTLRWRKSSFSSGVGESDCVELADITPLWRKSSFSGGEVESSCVELADLAPAVGVRDSKDPDGPRLILSRGQFASLVTQVKAGQRGR